VHAGRVIIEKVIVSILLREERKQITSPAQCAWANSWFRLRLLTRSLFAKTAHLNLSVSGRKGSARLHTHRSLGGSHLFEVGAGNEVWNIVVVGFSLGLLEQTLDLLILLRSNLLEYLRNHVL